MTDFKKSILQRVYILYIIILLFSIAIVIKILNIQLKEGKYWKEKAKEFSIKTEVVEATKGNIYADDGYELLATSIPIFELRLNASSSLIKDKDFKKKVRPLADSLSNLFQDRTSDEYYKLLMRGRKDKKRGGYLLLKRNVSYEQVKRVKKFPKFRSGKLAIGIDIKQSDKRIMPYDLLAKRTIGFIGLKETDHKDTIINGKKVRINFGKMKQVPVYAGLEGYYSFEKKVIHGEHGKRLVRLVSGGERLPIYNDSSIVEPKNGKDIVTTINVDLQEVAHNSLMEHLNLNEADHGCAILMEVETGQVKAIVNLKRDSSNSKVRFSEYYNYAIGESACPGSTFKLASLMVALEDGVIDTNTRIATGFASMKFGSQIVRDVHPLAGSNTIKKIFEESSNVGTVAAIWNNYHNNPQKFIDGLYKLKINLPLGIDIYGEKKPDIKDLTHPYWQTNYSLPSMAFGYEVELTPLQILTLYNAVANNGKMIRPMFVKEIRETGRTIEKFEPVVINEAICSKQTVGKLRKMMEGVVQHGTAEGCFKSSLYTVAGKTGTAQINFVKRGIDKMTYRASFVGYFPTDKPKYSCIVVITNPKKGKIYGGAVAAPVFKDLADKVYSSFFSAYSNELPERKASSTTITKVLKKTDAEIINSILNYPLTTEIKNEWCMLLQDSTSRLNDNYKKNNIPNVIGMGLKNAVYVLENAGYKVSVNGKGMVKSQYMAGPKLIKLELS